ncbi:MAG: hypothetical protein EBR30_19970 [Cytophagia bacterium]|nr:hypothetical protein [Cytophagia bacterium]
MFNIGSLIFLFQGLGLIKEANYFPKETRLIGALIFAGIVSGYYLINGRYQTIYSKLKSQYIEPPKTWYSIIVVLTYYLLSFGLLLLTGLYKNHDWIFEN